MSKNVRLVRVVCIGHENSHVKCNPGFSNVSLMSVLIGKLKTILSIVFKISVAYGYLYP